MTHQRSIIAVIPARYGSTRFPGKALALVQGKPMVQWVYERTSRSARVQRVIVATDDGRILQAVEAFGGEAVMTSARHTTGTDRIAEVARSLSCDIVVNVQGDEPLIEPAMIDEAVGPLAAQSGIVMGTIARRISDPREIGDPNVVKVVMDEQGYALYFSRAPILGPGPLDGSCTSRGARSASQTYRALCLPAGFPALLRSDASDAARRDREARTAPRMSSGTKPAPQRKTIGVFISQVGRAWGSEFIAGITDAAEASDVNVVHFIGGPLSLITSQDNKPSFGLYDLAKPEQLDGLILTADVAYGVKPADLNSVRRLYGSMPIVTQSVDLPGTAMFIPNNVEGMRSVLRHLIEEHGYKRIAFLRGIQGQIDAEQRFQAYREELKAHDLHYDESLVVQGDYTAESGRAAVRILLDERSLRFQALVTANDRMAFGALEALQQRGVRVPDDVAVTGFDDLREAQAIGVPLTTVRQSFYTAGRQAFETLIKRMEGATVPRTTDRGSSRRRRARSRAPARYRTR